MSKYFNKETLVKIANAIGATVNEVHTAVLESGMLNLAANSTSGFDVVAPVKVFGKEQKGRCTIEFADSGRFEAKVWGKKILFTKEKSPFSLKIVKKGQETTQQLLKLAK
ncbi:hypothetical protein COU37_04090 [Candidatus Micrarchaeota archaeon CG10_big_fil_rev_8_21_14_0_10_45_29]|nr:MAG: hypothetical protein COU37_04090 [Candidatus Micrarchaeota archaeon CG10_big_fil_rev_8_21_14_0_10_45_29]